MKRDYHKNIAQTGFLERGYIKFIKKFSKKEENDEEEDVSEKRKSTRQVE